MRQRADVPGLRARPVRPAEAEGRWRLTAPSSARPRAETLIRWSVNIVGAGGAAYFAAITLQNYAETHRLLGVGLFLEQMVVVVAYLLRRPARVVTRRAGDWILAAGGTFTPVLLRPEGAHPPWGVDAGTALQIAGLAICLSSLVFLGRSFGFAAADRGLVRNGPYAVVRHPVYSSYLLLQGGYVLQSLSLRNLLVFMVATGFNMGRAVVEEDVLAENPAYGGYRAKVRWRLVPGVW